MEGREYQIWLMRRLGVESLTEFQIVTVEADAELATELLAHNESNRTEKPNKIKAWSLDMRRKDWHIDGDGPIRIGRQGELYDGQNRMLALIMSGVKQKFVFYVGVSPEARLVVDTGTPRSFYDWLKMNKVPNAQALAGVVRFMWDLSQDSFPNRRRARFPSLPVLQAYMESIDFELAAEGLKAGDRIAHYVKANRTAVAALYYAAHNLDVEDCEDFFEKFKTGVDLPERHPILALRRTLDPSNPKRVGLNWLQYPLMVKAWNGYRDGREIAQLSYKRGGKHPEPWPVPH